ncbi:hypothetical protein ACFL1S_07130 [Pseudomonadota bacterium]
MTFSVGLVLMLVIWLFTGAADYHHRHVTSLTFTVIPLVVVNTLYLWQRRGKAFKFSVILAGLFYVCVPISYGVASVFVKMLRVPSNYQPGPSGLYNPVLSHTNAAMAVKQLGGAQEKTIRYVFTPVIALDIDGRKIVTHADFETEEKLSSRKYNSRNTLYLEILLPNHFVDNGKSEIILNSFGNSIDWKKKQLPNTEIMVWSAFTKTDD